MGYKFSNRSKANLEQADTNLVKLCYEVIKHFDFTVIESHRSLERQKELYDEGLSQIDGITQKGNHNYLPSRAIDIIPYEKGLNPFDGSEKSELLFYRMYREFERASRKLDIPIEWGGFWSFKDYPHIELKG
jgi:peptidoglycan L-alanyl-D-glutamate endopeptidase CwlK